MLERRPSNGYYFANSIFDFISGCKWRWDADLILISHITTGSIIAKKEDEQIGMNSDKRWNNNVVHLFVISRGLVNSRGSPSL